MAVLLARLRNRVVAGGEPPRKVECIRAWRTSRWCASGDGQPRAVTSPSQSCAPAVDLPARRSRSLAPNALKGSVSNVVAAEARAVRARLQPRSHAAVTVRTDGNTCSLWRRRDAAAAAPSPLPPHRCRGSGRNCRHARKFYFRDTGRRWRYACRLALADAGHLSGEGGAAWWTPDTSTCRRPAPLLREISPLRTLRREGQPDGRASVVAATVDLRAGPPTRPTVSSVELKRSQASPRRRRRRIQASAFTINFQNRYPRGAAAARRDERSRTSWERTCRAVPLRLQTYRGTRARYRVLTRADSA